MSESPSTSSRGSRRSNPESTSSRGSNHRPPQSPSSTSSPDKSARPSSQQQSSQSPSKQSQSPSSSNHHHIKNRRAMPSWCYVPPKEGGYTLRKNVLLFGKQVDVYWCPHHERWDTHRLRDCSIELQLESYKQQLEVFFVSRQELLETQQKLVESELKVTNQRIRLSALEQKLKDAGIPYKPSADLGEYMNRQETKSLKSQLVETQEELDTTRQELLESEAKVKKERQKRKGNKGSDADDNADDEQTQQDKLKYWQNRLYDTEKKSKNRQHRMLQAEEKYKEAKERLRAEQEQCRKLKAKITELERQLQEQSTSNGSPHSSNGHSERRDEADKSIYRLSESLATVTGALESERAARITLEKDFAQERKEYQEKLREAQTELERSQMLLVAKKQTSTTSSLSFRSNGHYVKICRLLVYSHHNVDDTKVQLIQETASKYTLGGFVKGGRPGLVVVEGMEEDCDAFLNALAEQHRNKLRESPKKKVESATFAAAGKVISQAETIDEGRAFPKELTQLDSEGGFDQLKALCASTGMLDLIDEVCKR